MGHMETRVPSLSTDIEGKASMEIDAAVKNLPANAGVCEMHVGVTHIRETIRRIFKKPSTVLLCDYKDNTSVQGIIISQGSLNF